MKKTIEERFYSNVTKTPTCWLWQLTPTRKGYGRFRIKQRTIHAHRVSFVLAGGVIPDQWEIDHLCLVRLCVNPAHLQVVPPGFNGLQGQQHAARIRRSRSHCKRGHEYTIENTRIDRKGKRVCRTCERELNRLKAASGRDTK